MASRATSTRWGSFLMRILTPTYTQMETVMLIEKLRQGELRESFKDYFPLLHELILQMLSLAAKRTTFTRQNRTGDC
jgi:hypothetical protein